MARFARLAVVFPVMVAIGSGPALAASGPSGSADANGATPAQRVLELRFTPTARAQIALWLEKPDGTFVKTLFLTQAVGYRGIGNRPGASQMNSGFHWPYGRREGVLPIWAHRRAAAPGAQQWKRVIFQHRDSEGDASQTSSDQSSEDYFCLSFQNAFSEKDALDAVSCATKFSSDKGRYMTSDDVSAGYIEPIDSGTRPLDVVSLYPPRTDVTRCTPSGTGCFDTPDVSTFADHARSVMPDLDSVTMATPPGGDLEQSFLFSVAAVLPKRDYVVWAEVNTEGDDNASYRFSTPSGPGWDSWAVGYGYSYRGQPSVAYKVPVSIGAAGVSATAQPAGYGDVAGWGPDGGALHAMDSTITDDPAGAPGSGADRFRLVSGRDYRLHVESRGGGGQQDVCRVASDPPGAPQGLQVTPVPDVKHSHEWGRLHFVVPASTLAIHDYEVRVSEAEITTQDPSTFDHAARANVAAVEDGMLIVPTTGAPGSSVDVSFGHLKPTTSYYVAVRANNVCGAAGPYVVGTMSTTNISFTKLSGCFVATAAFGSALEPRVQALRVARDELRPRSAAFSTAVDLYYQSGPPAAAFIARSDSARALVRTLLGPIVAVAQAASPAR